MIKKIIVCTLLFVAASSVAQTSTFSPYSLYGIGLETFRGDIASRSFGSLSTYSNVSAPNYLNPASYSDVKLTSLGVGLSYTTANIKAEEGTGSGSATTFDYLALTIPAGKFGIGFGFKPYRSVGYNFETIIEGDENDGVNSFEGSGNVNRIYLATGGKIVKGFKLGLELQYNFGRLEEEVLLELEELTFPARLINQSDIAGFSYTLSGIYDYKFKEDLNFRSTIIYSASGNIDSDNSRELSSVQLSSDDFALTVDENDIDSEDRSFELPSTLTLGVSLSKARKWYLGTEVLIQNNNDYQDRFMDREGVNYVDAFGFKAGGFYIPKFNSLTSYLSKVTYRAGFRFQELGLEINGTDINEFGISFGLGLPLPRQLSTLDIGFEVGSRGETTDVLVKENFFTVSLGLSLGQKWFKKRKFD